MEVSFVQRFLSVWRFLCMEVSFVQRFLSVWRFLCMEVPLYGGFFCMEVSWMHQRYLYSVCPLYGVAGDRLSFLQDKQADLEMQLQETIQESENSEAGLIDQLQVKIMCGQGGREGGKKEEEEELSLSSLYLPPPLPLPSPYSLPPSSLLPTPPASLSPSSPSLPPSSLLSTSSQEEG